MPRARRFRAPPNPALPVVSRAHWSQTPPITSTNILRHRRSAQETRDGWSDVPFDQQAAFAPDNPNESTFSEYATGRLIREATSLNRLGELMEGMPEPLGPKNASLALEKFALLGTSVPSGSAHAMRVVGGPEHVLAICKGVGGAPEARPPHAAVASRSLWALAELAKVSFLDGTTLIDRQAPEVQVRAALAERFRIISARAAVHLTFCAAPQRHAAMK